MIRRKIDELDGNLEAGKKYKVKKTGRKKCYEGEITGELVEKHDTYYLIKNNIRCECFLKVDFIIGDYEIERRDN